MQPSLCNLAALRRSMRRVNILYDEVLAPCGLRTTQYSLLSNIERMATPAVSQLAEELVMDRSALAHTLKPLERDGLVAVAPDPNDRRVKRVSLTDAGRARKAEGEALWRVAQDRFESVLGAKQSHQMRVLLDTLADSGFADRFSA
jgi:DNA-binding MarR family transcriptional regulator